MLLINYELSLFVIYDLGIIKLIVSECMLFIRYIPVYILIYMCVCACVLCMYVSLFWTLSPSLSCNISWYPFVLWLELKTVAWGNLRKMEVFSSKGLSIFNYHETLSPNIATSSLNLVIIKVGLLRDAVSLLLFSFYFFWRELWIFISFGVFLGLLSVLLKEEK